MINDMSWINASDDDDEEDEEDVQTTKKHQSLTNNNENTKKNEAFLTDNKENIENTKKWQFSVNSDKDSNKIKQKFQFQPPPNLFPHPKSPVKNNLQTGKPNEQKSVVEHTNKTKKISTPKPTPKLYFPEQKPQNFKPTLKFKLASPSPNKNKSLLLKATDEDQFYIKTICCDHI